MIQLVMKPERAPIVKREGLYSVRMNGEHLLHIRARNAPHAERKLAYCFKRELSGKTLDFNLEELEDGEGKNGVKESCQDPEPAPEKGAAHEETRV